MTDQVKYTQKLRGARVLVIGGSAGIGYGVAEACLENGAHVIISSSNQGRVDKAIEKLVKAYPSAEKRVEGYAYSMGDEATLDSNVKALFEKSGKLDHVVYTAGDSLAMIAIGELTMDQLKQAGMVRYFAPVMVAKYAPKYLNPGPASSITFTTGSVSEKPMPSWSVVNGYATALHGLNRGLALDLKPIRVNLVSPGAVDTDLWAGMSEEARKATFKSFEARSATGKVGQASDVAEAYLYCMKDHNLTGSLISTNAGALLM